MLEYYTSLPGRFAAVIEQEQNNYISLIQNMKIITARYNQPELSKEIDDRLNVLISKLEKDSNS